MFVLVVLLSVLFLLLLNSEIIRDRIRCYYHVSKIPGPPKNILFFNNLFHLQGRPEHAFRVLRKLAKKYYPIYKLGAFHRNAANILSPEDAELILSTPTHNEKGYLYVLLHNWLKFGLLTSTGSKWQTRRRILTPAFHFNILQEFIKVFNEEADSLVDLLKEQIDNSYIDVVPHVTQFTLKTITETAMGTKLNFQNKRETDYKKAVHDIGLILLYRISHPWCMVPIGNILFNPRYLKELRLMKILHNFTKEVVQEREKNFNEDEIPLGEHDVYKGKRRLAMLDLLLYAKRKEGIIDDLGIQEEVDTFMFEGHDTTSSALSFLLMLISNHPEVQERILQEMKDVLGDLKKKPTYNDLQSMKYLERCIKESLRLYPSVHVISRNLGQDVVTKSGYFLPKSSFTIIHIYDIHHNPDIYPDPEKFDPDRFLPENVQKRHPFAYLPFSAGSRNCIGQRFALLEIKVAVCAILGNFELHKIDTQQTVIPCINMVLKSREGVKIRFVLREKL